VKTKHAPDVALVVASLVIAYAVKSHYSRATADELSWILAPTAWLTSVVLARDFVRLPDAGYLSEELSILITPACAGVNFLIVSFLVLALGFGSRFGAIRNKALFLALSLPVAFAMTVVINGARIALSVRFSHLTMRGLGLSFQETHRLLGVATYLGGLVALVVATEAAFGYVWSRHRDDGRRAPSSRVRRTLALSLATYVAVTLFVPLVRGAARSPEYWDHAALVGGAVIALGGLAFALFAIVTSIHTSRRVRIPNATVVGDGMFSSANEPRERRAAGAETGSMEMTSHAFGGIHLRSCGSSGVLRRG
jgi:exosortase K